MKTLLVIGYVWPEPSSSAAGSRMMQLLAVFQQGNYKIIFASPAQASPRSVNLSALHIQQKTIKVNDAAFDKFIKELRPDVVLFDRFMMEEQFGWRVAENVPDAIRILDTEDVHSLRKARQEALKRGVNFSVDFWKNEEITKREMASILRCDLTLIISDVEMQYLKDDFQIPPSVLYYYPFHYPKIREADKKLWPAFEERKHFITIGNFMHQPNWDAVLHLKKTIWPLVRKQLPQAEMHVYGAYATNKHQQLHQPKDGFLIKGWAENSNEVMQQARICLAPLQFGAGLKGKLAEAMRNGTPSITTTLGAEGMHGNLPWNGYIADNPEIFAQKAVQLYTDKKTWVQAQQNGIQIINERFTDFKIASNFLVKIESIATNLKKHRNANFVGSLLQHHTLQSTKYLAKWIETKNKT